MAAFAAVLAGCSPSATAEGEAGPGSGVVTNPGGKPKTPEEEAYAKQMEQAGQIVNDGRSQMAEARKKAGQ